jgi:hypothetical protein
MKDTELAWLAGLWKGEGSFKKPAPSAPNLPLVTVSMTDQDVIERAANLMGSVTVRGHRRILATDEFGISKWLVYRIKEGKRAS